MFRNLAELDYRESDGITVRLLWNLTDGLVVRVSDERADEDLEIVCAPNEARDVFFHPFAYAAQRPVRYRQRAIAG